MVVDTQQLARRRERAMRRYTSPDQAQRFREPLVPIRKHFCPGRHRLSGSDHRTILSTRFAIWRDVTGVSA